MSTLNFLAHYMSKFCVSGVGNVAPTGAEFGVGDVVPAGAEC